LTRHRARRWPVLVFGLALAASLWFGVVEAYLRLHRLHDLRVGNFAPRIVDAGMLALNAALLVAFVAVRMLRRSGGIDADEGSE
jgi:hypothetical protein